jgi:hypothetical protein
MRYRVQVKFAGKWVNHAARPFSTRDLAEAFAVANVKPGMWRIIETK